EPIPLERRDARVVEQRVEPDVGDEALVEWHLDAPSEPALRARDRQILQRLAQKAEDLVSIALGPDPVGVGMNVLEQPLLIAAHAEEVVLFLDELRLCLVVGAPTVDELLLRVEALASRAVEAGVLAEIDVTALVHAREHLLDATLVVLVGRADEM